MKNMPQQISFALNSDGKLHFSKSTVDSFLNLNNQAVRAEILQALHVVKANQPFSSTNGDSDRFKHMLPDSEIGY